MIQTLAQLYVNVLEPAFKFLLIALAVVFVLYVFNLLRGGDKKNDLINGIVNFFVKTLVKTVQLVGKAVVGSLKMLLKTSRVIFATVRDFLKSEI